MPQMMTNPECFASARKPVGNASRSGSLFAEGDMNAFFRRLYARLNAQGFQIKVLSQSPWLVKMDGFLKRDAVHQLIEASESGPYSTRLRYEDVISDSKGERTRSGNECTPLSGGKCLARNFSMWVCGIHDPACNRRTGVARYLQRIWEVTRLSITHGDRVHVVRYGAGGFYRTHHDSTDVKGNMWLFCGARQLTLMVYLTDVAGGGNTRFPLINGPLPGGLSVEPRVGRALIWADTHADRPLVIDERTRHEAELVTSGRKYVVTTWFHAHSPHVSTSDPWGKIKGAGPDMDCCTRA